MDTSIVCGVDDSPHSDVALAVATRLANRLGARLVLAHVVEPVLTSYNVLFGGMSTAGELSAQHQVVAEQEAGAHTLTRAAETAGVDAELRVAVGHPAERLAELADDEGAELIVVGSRGRGAFKSAFLGSVSNGLVGIARCPVLIVPPGAAPS